MQLIGKDNVQKINRTDYWELTWNDNATLSFVVSARRVQRFLPISVAKSAAVIHRVVDDSASLSAPPRHTCRRRFDRSDGNGAAWLRRAIPDAQSLAGKDAGLNDLEDVALTAGAAIGALDAVVRRQERWAGAWRQRLALSAAAITAKQAGRVEDESALRDAVLLTRPGDNVGPAGRFLLAWRRLANTPVERLLTEASIGAVLDDLGLAHNDEGASDLTDDLRQLAANTGTVETLVGVFAAAEGYGFGRVLGAWLADVLLAQRLGWTHAIPLLGGEVALVRAGRAAQ